MAQANRTATLTLAAQTTGTEAIQELSAELQKLGKKAGEGAPEFERVSKELDAIAQQQDSVNSLRELSLAIDTATTRMTEAKKEADKERAALDALQATFNKLQAEEQQYAQTVREKNVTLQQANADLLRAKAGMAAYIAEIGGAKSATRAQKAEMALLGDAIRQLNANYIAAKAAAASLRPEYDALRDSTKKAGDAVKAQQKDFNSVAKEVDQAKESYRELSDRMLETITNARRLGIDTGNLVNEQNRLTQSIANLTTQSNNLKQALLAPATAAKTAGDRIEQAFGVIGVRSVNAIQAEILQVNNALAALARETGVSGEAFDRAYTAGKAKIAALEAELGKAQRTSKGFGSSIADAFRQFGPATIAFNAITAGLQMFVDAASKIPEVTAQFQTMERTLRILSGSTAEARKEMAYITDIANRVGTSIKAASEGYIKLAAATKDTNLEGAQTKRIFEAVAGAMGALGASADETTNAMQAVTQMVSKGVVSMEEFRQQLSERLPGAFQATAKQLGITTADLNDLISAGKLTADDVLPALAGGLEELYKTGEKNTTLRGQWEEIKNALTETANAIGESGIVQGLTSVARYATGAVTVLTEGFLYAGSVVAGAARAMKRDGNFDKELDTLAEKGRNLTTRFEKLIGVYDINARSMAELAKEAKAAGQEFFYTAEGVKVATDTVLGASDGFIKMVLASQKATASAEGLATAARKSAEYTRASGEASITAANALGSETDKREAATRVAENNAAALGNVFEAEKKVIAIMEEEAMQRAIALRDGKAKSDAHVKQLNDLGQEIEKRRAVVNGLEQQAEAQRLLAVATKAASDAEIDNGKRADEMRQKYLDLKSAMEILRIEQQQGVDVTAQMKDTEERAKVAKKLYTDAMKDEAIALDAIAKLSGNEVTQRNAAIFTLERQLQALRDVGEERSDEYAKAALQMEQLKIERQNLEDNSVALDAVRAKYVETKAAVEELNTLKAAGLPVDDQLQKAMLESAKASAIYSDALRDQKDKVDALKTKKLEEINVKTMGLKLEQAQLQTVYEVLKASGDEAGAAQTLVQIKRLEIQMAQLNAQAKKAEANASRLTMLAKIEEIKATGVMTEAKRAEIAALEASARAKEIEAQIADETANRLEQLAAVTESAGATAANAAGGYDQMADSMRNAADAADELNRKQSESKGVRNASGSSMGGISASSQGDFTETLYRRGGTIEEVKLAQKYVGELYQRNNATMLTGNLGTAENAARVQKMAINDAVDKALAAARQELRTGQAVDLGTSVNDIMQRNLMKTPLRSQDDMIDRIKSAGNEAKTQTININLGGKKTAVNVASQDDADKLFDLFKLIESDSQRSF